MFDPLRFDPMRILRRRPKSEWEKRHGTVHRRMVAASIDTMIFALTLAPLVDYWVVNFYGLPLSQPLVQEGMRWSEYSAAMKESGQWDRMLVNLRGQYYAYVVYSLVCWHFWNATPGKLICRLRIVDAKTGAPMGTMQSLIRASGYLLSIAPLGLGFLWINFNKRRRGFHDYFAGTEVVRWEKKPEGVTDPTSTP